MNFVTSFILYCSALLLGALGSCAVGSGVAAAFALEGVMLAGGMAGLLCSHYPVWVCLPVSGCVGAIFTLLAGAAAAKPKETQIFSGAALCGLAAALAATVSRMAGGVSYSRRTFRLEISGENATVFLPLTVLLFFAFWLFMFHTRWGLRLRLCRENAVSARNAGVRTGVARLFGALLCGFLGGVGGTAALIALGGGWRPMWGVGGVGFLALAAARLGRSRPFHILPSTLLLAFTLACADSWRIKALGVPEGWPRLLPFALALALLAVQSGRKNTPEAWSGESIL